MDSKEDAQLPGSSYFFVLDWAEPPAGSDSAVIQSLLLTAHHTGEANASAIEAMSALLDRAMVALISASRHGQAPLARIAYRGRPLGRFSRCPTSVDAALFDVLSVTSPHGGT